MCRLAVVRFAHRGDAEGPTVRPLRNVCREDVTPDHHEEGARGGDKILEIHGDMFFTKNKIPKTFWVGLSIAPSRCVGLMPAFECKFSLNLFGPINNLGGIFIPVMGPPLDGSRRHPSKSGSCLNYDGAVLGDGVKEIRTFIFREKSGLHGTYGFIMGVS